MTPWITKPIPFNIGQGAAAAAAVPCNFDYDYNCGTDQNTIGGDYGQYAIRNTTATETTVSTATWYLRQHTSGGSPSGTAQCHMYESDGTTKSASTLPVDVSGVTAGGIGEPVVFTFSPAVTWADDYYLAIEYGAGGTKPDTLACLSSYSTSGSCTSPTDMTYHYWINASSSWSSNTTYFLNCITACS